MGLEAWLLCFIFEEECARRHPLPKKVCFIHFKHLLREVSALTNELGKLLLHGMTSGIGVSRGNLTIQRYACEAAPILEIIEPAFAVCKALSSRRRITRDRASTSLRLVRFTFSAFFSISFVVVISQGLIIKRFCLYSDHINVQTHVFFGSQQSTGAMQLPFLQLSYYAELPHVSIFIKGYCSSFADIRFVFRPS